jgi:hypothetical protein
VLVPLALESELMHREGRGAFRQAELDGDLGGQVACVAAAIHPFDDLCPLFRRQPDGRIGLRRRVTSGWGGQQGRDRHEDNRESAAGAARGRHFHRRSVALRLRQRRG